METSQLASDLLGIVNKEKPIKIKNIENTKNDFFIIVVL